MQSFTNCSSTSDQESGITDLHPVLFHHILLKLPIKSVAQCRFVCKSWNQLISDPYFTKFYSESYQYTALLASQYTIRKASDNLETVDYLEIGSNDEVVRTPLYFPRIGDSELIKSKKCEKRLVGSCNGILCIAETPVRKHGLARHGLLNNQQNVWVINPLTGQSMVMPKVKGPRSRHSTMFAFGSTIDKVYYKIVRIVQAPTISESSTKILTVGVDDEWRDLDDSSFTRGYNFHGIALNGSVHWVEQGSSMICAFDIGKEIGHSIPSPPDVKHKSPRLAVLNGHLCLIHQIYNQFETWIKEKYGVTESWTKCTTLMNLARNCYSAIPIAIRRNGDYLFSIDPEGGSQNIVSFDPKTKKCVELLKDNCANKRHIYSEYVPSSFLFGGLVSTQM